MTRWGWFPHLVVGGMVVGWWGQPVFAAATAATRPLSTYDAKGKRDPFMPLVRDGRVVTIQPGGHGTGDFGITPVLGGILWDEGGKSLALINDTEAHVGDLVNGEYRVTEIRKDAVVLTHEPDGGPVVLTITFEDDGSKAPPSGAHSKAPPSGAKRR